MSKCGATLSHVGGAKVTIVPSTSPIAWVPASPATGGNSECEEDGSGPQQRQQGTVFSAARLGHFLRSHEDVSGVPKCTGVVRPVFEMKPNPQSSGFKAAFCIQPGAPAGQSALWLFTSKKIELPAHAFVALG